MLYGPVEEHTSPAAGGSLDRAENPRRKILTDPKEVREFMRKHMVEIYKKQDNLTPEARQVESFLRGIDDTNSKAECSVNKRRKIWKEKF